MTATASSLSSSGDLAAHHSGQVASWFKAWSERDFPAAHALLEDQATWQLADETFSGATAVRAALEELTPAGWSLHAEPLHIRADNEFAVAVVALKAREDEGGEHELPLATWWFRFSGGRLREVWSNFKP